MPISKASVGIPENSVDLTVLRFKIKRERRRKENGGEAILVSALPDWVA